MKQFVICILLSLFSVGTYGQSPFIRYISSHPRAHGPKSAKLNVIVASMPDGRDSIIRDVKIYSSRDKYKRQFELEYVDSLSDIYTIHVDGMKYYKIDNEKFPKEKVVMPNGEVVHLLANRKYFALDGSPSVYMVYDENGNGYCYAKSKTDSLLHMIPSADDMSSPNVLKDYLYERNRELGGENNDIIKGYISGMKPTCKDYLNVKRVVEEQNINRYNRFRWGVGAGVYYNMNHIAYGEQNFIMYSAGSQAQFTPMLFASVPLASGYTLNPDLSFNRSSCLHTFYEGKTGYPYMDVAYNVTSINLSVPFRFTYVQAKGRLLPFIEAGVSFRYNFNDINNRMYVSDNLGYLAEFKDNPMSGPVGVYHLFGGLGTEYRINPSHSLFFNVRYFHYIGNLENRNIIMKVNSLMVNLSYNL